MRKEWAGHVGMRLIDRDDNDIPYPVVLDGKNLVVLNLVSDGVAPGFTPLPVVVAELVGRGADEGAVIERELEALVLDDLHPRDLVTTPDQLILQTGHHVHPHFQFPRGDSA